MPTIQLLSQPPVGIQQYHAGECDTKTEERNYIEAGVVLKELVDLNEIMVHLVVLDDHPTQFPIVDRFSRSRHSLDLLGDVLQSFRGEAHAGRIENVDR